MSETFFEHEKSANAAVTIFKWADTFELHMEIQNLVKADIFLRFVFFDQGVMAAPIFEGGVVLPNLGAVDDFRYP